MERSDPSQNFVTGFQLETKSFTWTIKGYPNIRKYGSLINSQKICFTAGETTGHPSQWGLFLKEEISIDEKRWIGFFLQLESPHPTDSILKTMFPQVICAAKNDEGEMIVSAGFPPVQAKVLKKNYHGIPDFIDPDDDAIVCPENLVIEVTFKLYTQSESEAKPKSIGSLKEVTEKFQVTFGEKLRKDFADLLETPDPCSDIKIISSDEREFSVKKGILAVRSEVFAAMLRSDMTEANSGVIKLPHISSKALKVLLNFLKTGALLPEWSETGVILELTNAAAEYQLQDLLQFLDATLGKVCRLENVLALLTLTRQLFLRVAEEELMLFVRNEGVDSADKLFQMCSTTELPGIDSGVMSAPAAGANKGKKRRKNQKW